MSQLRDARCPEDDWTGVRDRAERRKRQNRLNVRAHRRRKAAAALSHNTPVQSESVNVAFHPTPTGRTDVHRRTSRQSPISGSAAIKTVASSTLSLPTGTHDEGGHPIFSFPLSRDHLITIVELNVYRASLTNINILGACSLLSHSTCGYAVNNPDLPLFPTGSGSIPDSLRPTRLQLSTPHEVWIDILPSPRMRDNAIVAVAEGRLRNEDLCADILGGICGESKGRVREPGAQARSGDTSPIGACGDDEDADEPRVLVWNNPWDASGWEVTRGFLRKWGYLLRGEGESGMLRATNRWRALRGEDPLVWEVE
jgi:hypothetical protein